MIGASRVNVWAETSTEPPTGLLSVTLAPVRRALPDTGDGARSATEGNPAVPAITNMFRVTERHNFVSPYAFPIVDYTDHWWNPQESGWGLSIMQHPSDRLFAVWFIYFQAGQPIWYALLPGQWTNSTTYTGPIYRTTGPSFAEPFNPDQVTRTIVGSGTLAFTAFDAGTFFYVIDGISGSKAITRLPF